MPELDMADLADLCEDSRPGLHKAIPLLHLAGRLRCGAEPHFTNLRAFDATQDLFNSPVKKDFLFSKDRESKKITSHHLCPPLLSSAAGAGGSDLSSEASMHPLGFD